MLVRHPNVRKSIIEEFGEFLGRRRIVLGSLPGIDLAPNGRTDPLQTVRLDTAMALFEQAAEKSGNPWLGLEFAGEAQPGCSGLFGELVVTAPTVRDMLKCSAGCVDLFIRHIDAGYQERNGVGQIYWSFPSIVTAPRVQFNLFLVGSVIWRVRQALKSNHWLPRSVGLDHRLPKADADRLQLFGPRIETEATCTWVVFDKRTLSANLPTANARRHAILWDLAKRWQREMAEEPEIDIVTATRNKVAEQLRIGRVDLATVADAMQLTSGQLKWRLERAGTHFDDVLTGERKRLADRYLRETNKRLTEIAYDLGFSDASTFSHFMRRCFGVSPREYRKRGRAKIEAVLEPAPGQI